MKVILLKDTAKLGKRGEVKEVADGYAINVLLKRGDALMATTTELTRWKSKEDAKIYKKELATNTFFQLLEKIQSTPLMITGKKADQKGQLFAQVKETDIIDVIFKTTQFSLNEKQVSLPKVIKSVGRHVVILAQGNETRTVFVEVV